MTTHELAIARSVMYAGLFDYPLTIDQLHRSLIGSALTREEMLAVFDRSDALQHIVEHRDGFFFPAGRAALVAERRRREARSRAFLDRHRLVLQLICAIPFTRLVALSGSIAHLNLEPEGDLDLFIITRGPRVWAVTLAVLLLTKLLGRRRVVCANFVIADSHLTLDQQDLFTANQIIHLKPLTGGDALDEFIAANRFVRRFYPNAVGRSHTQVAQAFRSALSDAGPEAALSDAGLEACATPGVLDRLKAALEVILWLPSPIVEAGCRALYGWHLRRRAASWQSPEQVRLQRDFLKLHTNTHRYSIVDRFARAVEEATRLADEVASDTPVRVRSARQR